MLQQNSTPAEAAPALARLPTVANVEDVTFIQHKGRIAEGGDVMRTSMTVSDAMQAAAKLCCRGFCFQGELREGIVEVWFKSKCADALYTCADIWTTVQVLHPHDPIAVPVLGPSLARATAARAAEARAVEAKAVATEAEPEPNVVVRGVPCFKASKSSPKGYGGYESFAISVQPEGLTYRVITCVQEGDFITCLGLSGESFQLQVPYGNEPFGSWLLPAVKAHMTCGSLMCLVDTEGREIFKEPQGDPVSLAGGSNYVCCEISGAECVREHLSANFAENHKQMSLLKALLCQESQVKMESTSEEWANHFGIFCHKRCLLHVDGMAVEIAYDMEDRTGA